MKPLNHLRLLAFASSLASLILLIGCAKDDPSSPEPPPIQNQGEITKVTTIANYSKEDIAQIMNNAGITIPFNLEYGVQVLAIEYTSIDISGKIIDVSGVFSIPLDAPFMPLLSIQHGTVSHRNHVASTGPLNSTEGIIGLITGSMGYFTILPDYAGFGVSKATHPYMHAESLVPNVVDLLLASKTYCEDHSIELNGQVFLTGYSEGGFVTLGTQKTLEENHWEDINLTAVAPLAGPYDLKGMCDTIFSSSTYVTPAYIAYFVSAYDHIYGWNRLADIFNSPYDALIPQLFDGSKTWGEVIDLLPESTSELLKQSFIDSYNNGEEQELFAALSENTLLDWTPQTPIHFIHGDADATVPIANALTAKDRLTSNGGQDIQLTVIPGSNHDTSGPAAIVSALDWFETYRLAK